MKVKELIRRLSELDQELPVYLDDAEFGPLPVQSVYSSQKKDFIDGDNGVPIGTNIVKLSIDT